MLNKIRAYLGASENKKILSFIIILVILAALPLTVIISQKQQEIRQRAQGAQDYVYFQVANNQATISQDNQEITFETDLINTKDPKKISALDTKITYDQSVLEYKEFRPSNILKNAKITEEHEGVLRYEWSNPPLDDSLDDASTSYVNAPIIPLGTIVFTAKREGIDKTTTDIVQLSQEPKIYTVQPDPIIQGDLSDGKFTIVPKAPPPTSAPTPVPGEDTKVRITALPDSISIISNAGVPNSNPAIKKFLNNAKATDAAGRQVDVTNNAPNIFPLGATVVTFTATDKSGNRDTGNASVVVRPPKADIHIKHLEVTPSTVESGQPVRVTTTLQNVGDAAGDRELTLKLDDSAVETFKTTIQPGESKAITREIVESIVGEHTVAMDGITATFKVQPKPTLIPTEAPIANTPTPTEKSTLIPPLTLSGADIRITSVTQKPIYLREGEKTTIDIVLRNFSNAPKPFSCNLHDGAFFSHRCSTENLNDYWHLNVDMDGKLVSKIFKFLLLQPGESKVVTYTFDSKNVSPGKHELKVYLSYLPEDYRSINLFIESSKPTSTPAPTTPIQRPTPTLTFYPCIAGCMDDANYSYCKVGGIYNRLNRTVDCDAAYFKCSSACKVSDLNLTPTLSPLIPTTALQVPTSTPTPAPTSTPIPTRLAADVDGDGCIGLNDFTILRFYLKQQKLPDQSHIHKPDISGDGEVDIEDFARLRAFFQNAVATGQNLCQ